MAIQRANYNEITTLDFEYKTFSRGDLKICVIYFQKYNIRIIKMESLKM